MFESDLGSACLSALELKPKLDNEVYRVFILFVFLHKLDISWESILEYFDQNLLWDLIDFAIENHLYLMCQGCKITEHLLILYCKSSFERYRLLVLEYFNLMLTKLHCILLGNIVHLTHLFDSELLYIFMMSC